MNSARCIKKHSLVSCELQWRCATAVVRMMKPYPNLSESVVQISCFWGWDLLKYLTATSDQFLHAYRWAQTSWIRFLQMAHRLWGRSLKISQTGFPISNNQHLPVPPTPQRGPGFDFQTKASLRTCWGHSAFSHCWMNTKFPFRRCQCLQTQSEALSSSEL